MVFVGFWGGIIFLPLVFTENNSEPQNVNRYENYTEQTNDNTETSDESYSDRYGSSDCTSDCSGHDAGYEWGEDNEVCDTDYDNGNSESFNEGVQQWADDNC